MDVLWTSFLFPLFFPLQYYTVCCLDSSVGLGDCDFASLDWGFSHWGAWSSVLRLSLFFRVSVAVLCCLKDMLDDDIICVRWFDQWIPFSHSTVTKIIRHGDWVHLALFQGFLFFFGVSGVAQCRLCSRFECRNSLIMTLCLDLVLACWASVLGMKCQLQYYVSCVPDFELKKSVYVSL